MRARLRRGGQEGFTLIEAMIVGAVGVVLMAGGMKLLVVVSSGEADARERTGLVQQARTAVEGITRELREGYGVEVAEPNRVVLLTYVNRSTCGGGPADSSIACRVSYECSEGTCTRTESSPTGDSGAAVEVVRGAAAEDVFSYAPSADEPTFVGVRLRMPTADGSANGVTLEDGVALRNAVLGS